MTKKTFYIIIIAISILSSVCSSCYVNAADNDTNAALIYIKAQSLLTVLPKDFIVKTNEIINNGWRDDNGELREILIKNQEALSEFKKAAKLSYCEFNSGISAIENRNIPLQFKDIGMLVRLALIEGRLCEQENKFDLALENYFLVLQSVNHLRQQKKYVLEGNILGTIWQKYFCQILAQYIRQATISDKEYYYIFTLLSKLAKTEL